MTADVLAADAELLAALAEPHPERIPVRTAADLDTLNDAEIMEGYQDGRAGEPEPGGNRSRSYWHGWRVGRVDGRHAEPDADAYALVADVVRNGGLLRAKGQTGPDISNQARPGE